MVNKIMKYLLLILIMFLAIIAFINYKVNAPKVYDDIICVRGKLLVKWEEDTAPIYTRSKGLTCEYEKDILIIDEMD